MFIGQFGANSGAFYIQRNTCWLKVHPSLVRMCMYKGAGLLYGNAHTLYINIIGRFSKKMFMTLGVPQLQNITFFRWQIEKVDEGSGMSSLQV